MRLPTHPPHREPTAQLEVLLRSAAAYEAPLDPPSDLMARALARWQTRRSRRRRLRAGLVMALLIGIGGTALTRLRGGTTPPQRMAAAPQVLRGAGLPPGEGEAVGTPPSDARRTPPPAPPPRGEGSHDSDTTYRFNRSSRGYGTPLPVGEGLGVGFRGNPARLRTLKLPRTLPRPAHRLRPRPPKAHWDERTVQRDVEGVLAPVWLVQADDDRGELLVTPAILQIQTKPAVFEAASGASENGVPVIEPAFPEGDHPANAR